MKNRLIDEEEYLTFSLLKFCMPPYITKNDYIEEVHEWEPFIPPNATKLILGTFPTAKRNRGAYPFFYPNPNNRFWSTIFQVAGRNISDYREANPITVRKQILTQLNLGITDMGFRVLRQKRSSSDSHLFPLEYKNILLLLEQCSTIKKIIITSSSGGNSALAWFDHYCSLNGIITKYVGGKKIPFEFEFTFQDRVLIVCVVSSCSQLSPYAGEELHAMYEKAIIG